MIQHHKAFLEKTHLRAARSLVIEYHFFAHVAELPGPAGSQVDGGGILVQRRADWPKGRSDALSSGTFLHPSPAPG